jgi:hypothetical protein
MLHQRHTRQSLQHFGQAAFHAGAFASSHDDDFNGVDNVQTHGVLFIRWGEEALVNSVGLSPDSTMTHPKQQFFTATNRIN